MTRLLTVAGLVVVAGCGVGAEATVTESETTLSYDAFLSGVYQEETGEFIANGDELFADEAALKAFYDERVARPETATHQQGLAIYNLNNQDVRWTATQAQNLTYCVSKKFGTHYAAVVAAMTAAGSAWSAVANVRFVHDATKDSRCGPSTSGVVFDVNPVNVGGQYLARAFFPNTVRRSRNIKIDDSAFTSAEDPTLAGVLRHELGHTLGFRHEHTRPEAGACFENNDWRALTTYDSASVMHYPQCNGTADWALVLTARDGAGARSVYP